jgi:hypothetical protein
MGAADFKMNSLTRKQWGYLIILVLVALHPSLLQLPVLALLFFMVQPGGKNEIDSFKT